jgi:hypothetical protein
MFNDLDDLLSKASWLVALAAVMVLIALAAWPR